MTRFCRKTTLTKHVMRNHPEWAHNPDAVSVAGFEEVDPEDWDGFAAAQEGDEDGDYGVPNGRERDDMQLPTPPTGYGFDGAPTTPEPASGNRRKQQRGSTGGRRSGRNAHGSAARRSGGDPDYGVDGDGSGSNQGKAYVTPPPSQHEVRRSKRRATRRRYADEVSEDDAGGQMDDEDDDEYREGAHEQHHHHHQQHPRRVSVGQGRRQLVYPSSAPYPPPLHARRTPRMVFIPPPNSPRTAPSPVAYQRQQLSASPRYEHGQDSPHHHQEQQQYEQQQSPDQRLSPVRGQLLTPSPQPPYAQLQRSVSHDGAMFHYAYSPSASPRPSAAAAAAELHAAAAPPVSLSYPLSVPMDHPTHSAPIPQSYHFSPLMSSPLRESQPIRYHRRASSAGLLDSMSEMSAFASPRLDQHALPAEGNGPAAVVGAGASSSTPHHGHDDEGSMYGLGLQLDPAVNIETTHERRLSEIHRIASPIRHSFGLYDFDLNGGQPSPTSAFFPLGGNGSSHRRESANFPSFPTFPGGGGLSSTLVAPGTTTTTNGGRKPSFGTITNQLLESMEAERSEDHLEFVHEEEDEDDGDESGLKQSDKLEPEPEREPASEHKQEKDEAKEEEEAKKEGAEKAEEKEQEKKEEQTKLPKDVVMETDA